MILRRARPGADLSSAKAAGPAGESTVKDAELAGEASERRRRVRSQLVTAANVDQVAGLVRDFDPCDGHVPGGWA